MLRKFRTAIAVAALATLGSVQAAQVTVRRSTPYGQDSYIADNIKRECKLTEQLPEFLAHYAKEKGVEVTLVDRLDEQDPGRVLVLHIVAAMSQGNAFIGHAKSTTVKGELYEDHQLIGDFIATRNSMGGMFAGFKGSCSVLGRTVKAIGEDIGDWLTHPAMKSALGDR
jgi:hypothetical protein